MPLFYWRPKVNIHVGGKCFLLKQSDHLNWVFMKFEFGYVLAFLRLIPESLFFSPPQKYWSCYFEHF